MSDDDQKAEISTRRVELVESSPASALDNRLLGAGLLLGLFLGRSSLIGAATGRERIEVAFGHFVLVVLVCAAGLVYLGRFVTSMMSEADAEAAHREPVAGDDHGDDGSAGRSIPGAIALGSVAGEDSGIAGRELG
jgi:hypothetical protein